MYASQLIPGGTPPAFKVTTGSSNLYDPQMRYVIVTDRVQRPELTVNIAALLDSAAKCIDGVRTVTIAAPMVARPSTVRVNPPMPALWDLGGGSRGRAVAQFTAGPRGERTTFDNVILARYLSDASWADGRMLLTSVRREHHVVFAARDDHPDLVAAGEPLTNYTIAVYRITSVVPMPANNPKLEKVDRDSQYAALNLQLVAYETATWQGIAREEQPDELAVDLIAIAKKKISGPQRRPIHYESVWRAPWRARQRQDHFVPAGSVCDELSVPMEHFIATVHRAIEEYRDHLVSLPMAADNSRFRHLPCGITLSGIGEEIELVFHLPRRHNTMREFMPDLKIATRLAGKLPEEFAHEFAWTGRARSVADVLAQQRLNSLAELKVHYCALTSR